MRHYMWSALRYMRCAGGMRGRPVCRYEELCGVPPGIVAARCDASRRRSGAHRGCRLLQSLDKLFNLFRYDAQVGTSVRRFEDKCFDIGGQIYRGVYKQLISRFDTDNDGVSNESTLKILEFDVDNVAYGYIDTCGTDGTAALT